MVTHRIPAEIGRVLGLRTGDTAHIARCRNEYGTPYRTLVSRSPIERETFSLGASIDASKLVEVELDEHLPAYGEVWDQWGTT
jgi:hypothetical protein